jgi:hypothetical protein
MNEASISPIISSFRSHLRNQREARRNRAALRHELAQYTSAADRLELEAIMDRHSPEETVEIRSILSERMSA